MELETIIIPEWMPEDLAVKLLMKGASAEQVLAVERLDFDEWEHLIEKYICQLQEEVDNYVNLYRDAVRSSIRNNLIYYTVPGTSVIGYHLLRKKELGFLAYKQDEQ